MADPDFQDEGAEAIAIVGMAGRFPGARDVRQFWANLLAGRETVSHFAPDELDPGDPYEAATREEPNYVRARGILDEVEDFDAGFFGIQPGEARVLDPQQRLFMETAWEALETAGYDPQRFDGAIGVFAGMSNNSYFQQNLIGRRDVTELVGWLTTMMANEKDYLATRVSYKFDLRGPALNVQTACSTSLVAVAGAVQSLLDYQCDMALAGGVSVTLPQRRGYLQQDGGITSPDGHCRTFDRAAAGTVFSNGVGIVALRRLSDAIADGDTVVAVIRGAGCNNDGAEKVSFTAPSVAGHAGVIAQAQALAGVDPATISYVEAHGTATPLGDPIEIAGLTQAFRSGGATGTGYCAIGSVKTNIGHLDAAAGVAGLIKTALALQHRTLPASLHFTEPNPSLGLEDSPFRVVAERTPWEPQDGTPRRAGVSSFGVGGTNAHVVLEEAPGAVPAPEPDSKQLLVLSARSAAALDAATERLRDHLAQDAAAPLADTAFTLQAGRRRFAHRRAVVAGSRTEAVTRLGALDPAWSATGTGGADDATVAFMFPGQGAQAVGMGRGLYAADPAFRTDVDECCAVLREPLGFDLREVLYPEADATAAAEERLLQTAVTQPALFVVEYALARAWERLGVTPDGMIGHSVGEFVAACLAGVFGRDDALRLVAERGRLMQAMPPGAMLAVRAPAGAVREQLEDGLEVAAENAPALTVVSGATDAVDAFERRAAERELGVRRLATSHAFHSAMMDPILEPFGRAVESVTRSAPAAPWVSTLTGDWIESDEAQDADYWVEQLRRPVRFASAVTRLLEDRGRVPLEVGPGRQLTGLARQAVPDGTPGVTSLDADGDGSLLAPAGRLWVAGVALDWPALHGGGPRRRVPLPTYPFERTRHWVDPAPAPGATPDAGQGPAPGAAPPDVDPLVTPPATPSLDTSISQDQSHVSSTPAHPPTPDDRRPALAERLRAVFADLSGMDPVAFDGDAGFLELGLDSLFLTQAAVHLQKAFGVKVSFRDLLGDLGTIGALAEHLDEVLPPEEATAPPAPAPAPAAAASAPAAAPPAGDTPSQPAPGAVGASAVERLIADQLEVMRRQLETLRGAGNAAEPDPVAVPAPATPPPATANGSGAPERFPEPSAAAPAAAAAAAPATLGPYRPPARTSSHTLSEPQGRAVRAFVDRYTQRTAGSKRATAEHRPHLADPRTVAGFRPLWKEAVYPIVTVRSAGSRLWDVDGNEYVDLTNGFGSVFFGHNPDFVREAVRAQLDDGIEIGPQTPLAGEVAARVAAMVGMERVAFCNTGSEAVTAAIRVARTVSGRDRIAIFDGAYHGIFDEVVVRAAGSRAMPIAPGIPAGMVEHVDVLQYGSPEAIEFVREHGAELAAVLVEPVQSRRPELQPREFLHDLRRATEASGTALVFDEIVTGFRTHPAGAQAIFGVRADIATYGKVIGGGLPIGLVTGRAEYLDALDGGSWQYGDDSVPEVGVTFFAGTFVRHPLALAAARAVVARLEEAGPDLQRELNLRTTRFAERLDAHAREIGAPIRIAHFSSWIYPSFPGELPHAGLFFAMMRHRGIHVWEGRCWFLATTHSDADLERVFDAYRETLAELQASDLLPGAPQPPVPGARRGRDAQGREAWFVPDPERPGGYLQLEEAGA